MQRKNINFWNNFWSSFWIYIKHAGLNYFINSTYQFNLQSMGWPDKLNTTVGQVQAYYHSENSSSNKKPITCSCRNVFLEVLFLFSIYFSWLPLCFLPVKNTCVGTTVSKRDSNTGVFLLFVAFAISPFLSLLCSAIAIEWYVFFLLYWYF